MRKKRNKVQFMKKLTTTEAELRTPLLMKKACSRKVRYTCKNLLNLYCKGSIPFDIFQDV